MKKKLPYGISDFKLLRTENYYFVDKTKYIPLLEECDRYLMFLRPRRFGKSLWIAILEAYYDVYYKPEFDAIFKGTWIYDNRTSEASSYQILRLDFSGGINTARVEDSFAEYLICHLESFVDKYNLNFRFKSQDPINMLDELFVYVRKNNLKLYILIDEYDNFANNLLINDQSLYKNIVTDKTAFFKRFFAALKGGASGNDAPVKRLFITGVTPMTMFDVTSGFNIGKNISVNPDFNEMVGITEEELKKMYEFYEIDFDITQKNLVSEWYNGYKFHRASEEYVYNTDMILYYLDPVIKRNRLPDDLIDINVRSDYRKLQYLIYTDGKLNGNFELLRKLIRGETISINEIVQDFSAFNLVKRENFVSLLFYLGLVSIGDEGLKLNLRIPNETVKRIDIEYLNGSLESANIFSLDTADLSDLLAEFALHGKTDVFEYLAEEIKRNTAIRDYIYNEACIKSMYLAYLSLTSYYVIKSEEELNKGFADIFLKPLNPYVEYVGLVEIKYLPRKNKESGRGIRKPSKQQIEDAVNEAKKQLQKYQQDELVTTFMNKGKKLQKVILVFHGWELIRVVSETLNSIG